MSRRYGACSVYIMIAPIIFSLYNNLILARNELFDYNLPVIKEERENVDTDIRY